MSIKGTESEKNLKAALAGESIARNKYTYYAMAARKEGLDQVADEFERLAQNEMQHAKVWYEYLNGEPKATADNLKEASAGEFEEWHNMYPGFARKAREEGLDELAAKFDAVAAIEKDHEMQFMQMFSNILTGKKPTEPAKKTSTMKEGYRCLFCGAVYENRPDVCGVCKAIGSFENCVYQK